MLQSACSADATEGAHRHGGAALARDDDPPGSLRVCPHLVRPALPDYRPPRVNQGFAHLPVLLGHVFERITPSGHGSVTANCPPAAQSDFAAAFNFTGAHYPKEQRGTAKVTGVSDSARSRPSAAADSRYRSRSARSGSRDVPVRARLSAPLSRGGILVAECGAPAHAAGKGRLHMQSAPDARQEGRSRPP
jgi:hypothetical protein